jgi:hypothetical protein
MGEFAEPHDDRHTATNGSRRVSALCQPSNVSLDWPSDPGSTDAINGIGQDEISLQHDNLLTDGKQ